MSLPMTNKSVLRFIAAQPGEIKFEDILKSFEKDPKPRHYDRLRLILSGLVSRQKVVQDGQNYNSMPEHPPVSKPARKRKTKLQAEG